MPTGNRRVYWAYFGQGEREAACLLNGLAMSTESWQPFLPRMLDSYDVLLYDYPGQGQSSFADDPCSIPSLGDDLIHVLDFLEIPRIHLMGISYGGFVALDFARLHQGRLITLALSGILLTQEELFQMYQALSLRFYRSGADGFELYTHYMYEKIFGESFVQRAKEHLERMRKGFHDRYADRVHCLIRLTEAQVPFFAALVENLEGYRAIAVPTLIIVGAEDRVILPAVQHKICGILPNTRFELVEDAGHVVYLEQPETFFGTLKRFMRARR